MNDQNVFNSMVTNPKSCIEEVWVNLSEIVKDLVGEAYSFFKDNDCKVMTKNIEILKSSLSPTAHISMTRLLFYFMTNLNLHTAVLRNKQNTLSQADVDVYNCCASILAHVNKKQFDPYSKDVIQFRWPNLDIHLTLPEYLFYYFIFYYQIAHYFPKVCALIEVAYTQEKRNKSGYLHKYIRAPPTSTSTSMLSCADPPSGGGQVQDDVDQNLIQIRLKGKNKKSKEGSGSKKTTKAKTRSKNPKRQKVLHEGGEDTTTTVTATATAVSTNTKKTTKKNISTVAQGYENKLKRKQKKLQVASVNSHKISAYYLQSSPLALK